MELLIVHQGRNEEYGNFSHNNSFVPTNGEFPTVIFASRKWSGIFSTCAYERITLRRAGKNGQHIYHSWPINAYKWADMTERFYQFSSISNSKKQLFNHLLDEIEKYFKDKVFPNNDYTLLKLLCQIIPQFKLFLIRITPANMPRWDLRFRSQKKQKEWK